MVKAVRLLRGVGAPRLGTALNRCGKGADHGSGAALRHDRQVGRWRRRRAPAPGTASKADPVEPAPQEEPDAEEAPLDQTEAAVVPVR